MDNTKMTFANLHTHTFFSDGLISPAVLARRIYETDDLDLFSLTDHDSLSGIEPFFREKERLESRGGAGRRRFIPGIELSLKQFDLGLTIHMLGYFPRINHSNYRQGLERADSILGDFCRYRCSHRVIPDMEARVQKAFELNLDGISQRMSSPEEVISILKKQAAGLNLKKFAAAGKQDDVIQHPIPVTYQIIIENWDLLVPRSPFTREKISLYILRPDKKRNARLLDIFLEEGMAPSTARQLSDKLQGCLYNFPRPPIEEKGILEGLELLKQAGAVTFIAHPAVDHNKISYHEFDANVLRPLMKQGLDGIEVFYPYDTGYRQEAIERYGKIAAGKGLLISGGTDYHGDGRSGLTDVLLDVKDARRIIDFRP